MAETDRELLELAAKASGIGVDFECTQWGRYWAGEKVGFWNPLTDDGDALRLAVKLRISLVHEQEYIGGKAIETIEAIGPADANGRQHCEMHSLDDDLMGNVRRCIVRAAAAIWKDVKP